MQATTESRALVTETAVRAGLSPNILRTLAEKGAVPALKVGKYWSFNLADLELIREAAAAAGHRPIVVAAPSPV